MPEGLGALHGEAKGIRLPYVFRGDLQYILQALHQQQTKMVVTENEKIAGATIELLEARLRRLEYFLTGDTHWTGQPTAAPKPETFDDTVARRLTRLNSALESLGRNVPAVQDVLQLC